jgi:hypothetical protein
LGDSVLARRARHAITEQLRVKEAADALEKKDLIALGTLLDASHASLKNDYEVSGIELDTLVETARSFDGCIGARMTGAGFGGCAIALVHKSAVDNLIHHAGEIYREKTSLVAEFYQCATSDGVGWNTAWWYVLVQTVSGSYGFLGPAAVVLITASFLTLLGVKRMRVVPIATLEVTDELSLLELPVPRQRRKQRGPTKPPLSPWG